jgi:hypothetical protein
MPGAVPTSRLSLPLTSAAPSRTPATNAGPEETWEGDTSRHPSPIVYEQEW